MEEDWVVTLAEIVAQSGRRYRAHHEDGAPNPGALDRDQYQELRGRYESRIYPFRRLDGSVWLAVSSEHSHHQTMCRKRGLESFNSIVFLFPVERLHEVAKMIGVKVRRPPSAPPSEKTLEGLHQWRDSKAQVT